MYGILFMSWEPMGTPPSQKDRFYGIWDHAMSASGPHSEHKASFCNSLVAARDNTCESFTRFFCSMEMSEMGQECPWGVESYMESSFMLVLNSCYGAGDFFLSRVLMQLLTTGKGYIVLISANHGPEHWECLLRKHSLELRRRGLLGRLCIKYIVPCAAAVSEAERKRVSDSAFSSEHMTWREAWAWQKHGMPLPSGSSSEGSFSLFIDDLDALETASSISASVSSSSSSRGSEALQFMHALLHSLRTTQRLSCLAALGAASASPNSSSSSGVSGSYQSFHSGPSLTEACSPLANITVAVQPLSSGYSQDVHGVVHITALPVRPGRPKEQQSSVGNGSGSNTSYGSGSGEYREMRILEESHTFKATAPSTIFSHHLIGGRFK